MRTRFLIVLTMALLTTTGVPSAWAFIITNNQATAGPSSLTHTFAATNDTDVQVTLAILVANDDYLAPIGSAFGRFIADADFGPGSGTVVLSGYIDLTNATPPGTVVPVTATLIGTANETTVPFSSALVPFTIAPPYSLLLKAELTLAPLSSLSFTHTVFLVPAVPEPGAWGMLTLGLLLLGVRYWCSRPSRARM